MQFPQLTRVLRGQLGKKEEPGEEEGEQQEEEKEMPFVLVIAEGTDKKPAGGQWMSGIAGVLGTVPTVMVMTTTVIISNSS